jgi:hypothetical protein
MNILEFLKSASPKTWLIFLLAAAVLIGIASVGTHSGGGKTAGAVDLEEYAQLPDYPVQDLRIWGQGEVRVSDEPLNMTGYRLYKYKLSREVLEEYIAMMQSNGFTLVGSHSDSSFLGSYQSYGLMCDGATDIPTIQQMYTDTPCHVNIWKSDSKWWVEVADGVALCDMGLRRDGSVESILPQGDYTRAWSVSGNILTVEITGRTLEYLNELSRRIEKSPIVDTCAISTAVKNEQVQHAPNAVAQTLVEALDSSRRQVENGLEDFVLSSMINTLQPVVSERIQARLTIYLVKPPEDAADQSAEAPQEGAPTEPRAPQRPVKGALAPAADEAATQPEEVSAP